MRIEARLAELGLVLPEPVRPPQRLTAAAPKFEDAPAAANNTPAVPPKV